MNYKPDRWLPIEIDQDDGEKLLKIFGVWSGGYTHGDQWRLNSGVEEIEEDEDYYYFKGYSGSVYQCHKRGYGSTAYGYSVINGMLEPVKHKARILPEEK